jgi:hypothetical protein
MHETGSVRTWPNTAKRMRKKDTPDCKWETVPSRRASRHRQWSFRLHYNQHAASSQRKQRGGYGSGCKQLTDSRLMSVRFVFSMKASASAPFKPISFDFNLKTDTVIAAQIGMQRQGKARPGMLLDSEQRLIFRERVRDGRSADITQFVLGNAAKHGTQQNTFRFLRM